MLLYAYIAPKPYHTSNLGNTRSIVYPYPKTVFGWQKNWKEMETEPSRRQLSKKTGELSEGTESTENDRVGDMNNDRRAGWISLYLPILLPALFAVNDGRL